MTNKEKKEFLELKRNIEVKETYCKHCTSCNACYQEGNFGEYNSNNADCKKGLYYADSKQLKKDLAVAHNYIPGNFYL